MARMPVNPLRTIDESRVFALLSYLSVLCVIPLIHKKDDAFVQDHGRQGLALFLCEFIAFLLTIVLPWLWRPFFLVFGLLSLWGMIKTLRGERVELPLIYQLSRRMSL